MATQTHPDSTSNTTTLHNQAMLTTHQKMQTHKSKHNKPIQIKLVHLNLNQLELSLTHFPNWPNLRWKQTDPL